MDAIDEIRSFNRFYTREIGLLAEHLPASDLSLAEARVLYEIATGGEQSAADIGRTLGMDRAHLSRIVARFRARGLIDSRVSPEHGKRHLLSLTATGLATFDAMKEGTRRQMADILSRAGSGDRMVAAMREIRTALSGAPEPELRKLQVGDLGWVTHRQAVLYAEEYGWDWTYEGLVSEIFGRFVADFDPAREDAWIAARGAAVVGSIFLMKGDEPAVGKLRLLYVEPSARGFGLGRRLVDACTQRSRELGYRQLTLWTNSVLVSARRIYEAAGFRLVAEAPHHSFGHDLVGQTWSLDL